MATITLFLCRDSTNRQHGTPGLAIVAAVGAAAERGGAAWGSVKSLLPQVHIALERCLLDCMCHIADQHMQHDWLKGLTAHCICLESTDTQHLKRHIRFVSHLYMRAGQEDSC